MPGIVGLITKMPREWAEPQLRRMVKTLCHEPFYRSGVWIDESLVCMSDGRSVKDLSATACRSEISKGMST